MPFNFTTDFADPFARLAARHQHYILDPVTHVPRPVGLLEWAQWFETANRHVARTAIGSYEVSTVFLGLDHNSSLTGPPLLFETMVFTSDTDRASDDDLMRRYTTWEQALHGHAAVCAKVQQRVGAEPARLVDLEDET